MWAQIFSHRVTTRQHHICFASLAYTRLAVSGLLMYGVYTSQAAFAQVSERSETPAVALLGSYRCVV